MSKKEYRVEQCRDSGRVFIATDTTQVEVMVNELGIEVQITRGNEVLAECGVDHD